MNKKVNKLLHKFFYDCHRKLWDAIIKYIKANPCCNDIHFAKMLVKSKIFGDIKIKSCCFGCHLALTHRRFQWVLCDQCFLGLSKICNNWHFYFPYGSLLKNRIELCKKIRDCGYTLTNNKRIYNKMVDLFIEMMGDL